MSRGPHSGDSGASDWEQRLPPFFRPPEFLGSPDHPAVRVVSLRFAAFLLAAAVLLVPWTIYLFLTLPPHQRAERWDIVWGGFDAMLIVAFAFAALRILRMSVRGTPITAVAATLLVTDAWFDVMTASDTAGLVQSLLMAFLVELPMAAILIRASVRVLSLLDQGRRYLVEAGFTVRDGKLVPPADWGAKAGRGGIGRR